MSPSALLGQPPISPNDDLIYKGLFELSPSFLKAVTELPHVSRQSKGANLLIASSVSISLTIIITCFRLWVRTSRRGYPLNSQSETRAQRSPRTLKTWLTILGALLQYVMLSPKSVQARIFRSRVFGPDDMTIIPACIGCAAYLAIGGVLQRIGCLGQHIYNCTYQEYGYFYMLRQSEYPIFAFTVFMVKISIVLQNRRITGMTSKRWQIVHWTYLALFICLLSTLVCISIFACSPIATAFTLQAVTKIPERRTTKCWNIELIGLITRLLHILTDWLLLPIPLIIIWQLHMPLGKKLRLMSVFCVGFISSIASIVTLILVARIKLDITYGESAAAVWDGIDVFFATIVASFPALNSVLDACLLRLNSWASSISASILGRVRTVAAPSQNPRCPNSGKWFRSNIVGGKDRRSFSQLEEPSLHLETDIELQQPVQYYGNGKPF